MTYSNLVLEQRREDALGDVEQKRKCVADGKDERDNEEHDGGGLFALLLEMESLQSSKSCDVF